MNAVLKERHEKEDKEKLTLKKEKSEDLNRIKATRLLMQGDRARVQRRVSHEKQSRVLEYYPSPLPARKATK